MKKSIPFQTRTGIAELFDINYKTLMNHLKKAKIGLPSGDISPQNQKRIFETLGYPNEELKAKFKHLEQ